MNRAVKWGLRGAVGILALSLCAGCGLCLAYLGLDLFGYIDEAKAVRQERQAAEESLVKARVVLANLGLYTRDRGILDLRRVDLGLDVPPDQVLRKLRAGGLQAEAGPPEERMARVVLSRQGGLAELRETLRAAQEAGLFPYQTAWKDGRVEAEATLIERPETWGGPLAVKLAEPAEVPPFASHASLFDLTGMAEERERLSHVRKEIAALEAAAPGILEMTAAYERDNKALEACLRLLDQLRGDGLEADDLAKAQPALAMFERGELGGAGGELLLTGTLATGAEASKVRAALEGAFTAVKVREDPVLRVTMRRQVERPEPTSPPTRP